MQSQMPSQPISTNSSAPPSGLHTTSGCAVISCALRSRLSLPLYLRSPSARLRFRLPLIRPWGVTQPPAASTLANSGASCGLWSTERGTATPSRQSTARESPAFAMIMEPRRMATATAVHPASTCDGGSVHTRDIAARPPDTNAWAAPESACACAWAWA
eukprot:966799-Pleurochrysis_carterae.AAC.1